MLKFAQQIPQDKFNLNIYMMKGGKLLNYFARIIKLGTSASSCPILYTVHQYFLR